MGDNSTFVDSILEKQSRIREEYKDIYCNFSSLANTMLSHGDANLFQVMERMHFNSHTTDRNWLEALSKISHRLDVQEKMPKLEHEFHIFLR